MSARESAHDPGGDAALLLLLGTPDEVLERIVPGDPLGLAALVAHELRRHAYLLDAECVLRRVFAGCARAATSWRGSPALPAWLTARVSEALADVLRCERHDAGGAGAEGVFRQIARPLGLRSGPLRAACARFNALDQDQREALFSVLIEGEPLQRFARRTGVTAAEAARRARRALELFRDEELDDRTAKGEAT